MLGSVGTGGVSHELGVHRMLLLLLSRLMALNILVGKLLSERVIVALSSLTSKLCVLLILIDQRLIRRTWRLKMLRERLLLVVSRLVVR